MRKVIAFITLVCFCVTTAGLPVVRAQDLALPLPGQMVGLSDPFSPAMMRGITVDPADPFSFKFLMEPGDGRLAPDQRETEYNTLIKYFLASLAIPEDDLWVNLSPYEKERIIADNFGRTGMGRDLLLQDHMLKQVTASLLHPDTDPGKAFWQKVYQAAFERYGTTDVPLDTFNKVWIVPDRAQVFEHDTSVVLTDVHLKVLLEADYLAEKQGGAGEPSQDDSASAGTAALSRDVVREIILPLLEKEVNEGKNFAILRQITASLVLATWYKTAWKNRLLNSIYSDRSKVKGVDQDPARNQEIYQQYVEAFQKGVFNLIREDHDALTNETVPRKYFSGGYSTRLQGKDGAQASRLSDRIERIGAIPQGWAKKAWDLVGAKFSRQGKGETSATSLFVRTGVTAFILGLFLAVTPSAMALQEKNFDLANKDARIVRSTSVMSPKQQQAAYEKIFRNYIKKNGFPSERDFPALAPLLKSLEGQDPSGLTIDDFLREARAGIKRLQAAGDEEGAGQATHDLTHLAQLLVSEWIAYNPDSRAVIDTLNRSGFNCESISRLTVMLMWEAGMDNVSVVNVLRRADGKTYPDRNGIGHAAVLVIKPDGSAEIHDQGQIFTRGYVIEVIKDGKTIQISIEKLSEGRSRFQGLTWMRLTQLLEAQDKFATIFEGMARWGKLTRYRSGEQTVEFRVDTSNAGEVAREFPFILTDLDNLGPGVDFDEVFRKNVDRLKNKVTELLDAARKIKKEVSRVDGENATLQKINNDFNQLVSKHNEVVGLLNNGKYEEAKTKADNLLKTAKIFLNSDFSILAGVVIDKQKAADMKNNPERFRKRVKDLISTVEGYQKQILQGGATASGGGQEGVEGAGFGQQFSDVLVKIANRQPVMLGDMKRWKALYDEEGGREYTFTIDKSSFTVKKAGDIPRVIDAVKKKFGGDHAQLTTSWDSSNPLGGIDLNPQRFVLDVQGQGDFSSSLTGDPLDIQSLEGLLPEIIFIQRTVDYLSGFSASAVQP